MLTPSPIPAQEEVLRSMDSFVEQQLPLLKTVKDSWQPSDVLPDLAAGDWVERINELRKGAALLTDEALIVLIGNVVTEEALPSYQTWLNRASGLGDETGASETPWGLWTRGWTAEENRHGELLGRYLYLSGRVNMRAFEVTVQYLLKNGFDLNSGRDPYRSLVYASFQERATKISHANTAKLAERCGDSTLSRLCLLVAGDEARHEEAYKRLFGFIVQNDSSASVIAFAEMMRRRIAMPARLMSDGTDRNLFEYYAIVTQRTGVYTTHDYAGIIAHLVEYWRIGSLTGLSANAREAQEYLCGLSAYFRKKADRAERLVAQFPKQPFSWIFDCEV